MIRPFRLNCPEWPNLNYRRVTSVPRNMASPFVVSHTLFGHPTCHPLCHRKRHGKGLSPDIDEMLAKHEENNSTVALSHGADLVSHLISSCGPFYQEIGQPLNDSFHDPVQMYGTPDELKGQGESGRSRRASIVSWCLSGGLFINI
jgi:hypothetical protein